jgi:GT2 family glycosyltransferase
MTKALDPITPIDTDAEVWPGATWVGQIDETGISGEPVTLLGGGRFARARLLVWSAGQPRGFVEVPATKGAIDGAALAAQVAELPPVVPRDERDESVEFPPISVVVCTRDRPQHLRLVLGPLSRLDYPDFEIVVVDNNPGSGLTAEVVRSFADGPVRLIDAAGQGLSIARNAALKYASHDIVAFTDDDVIVDQSWLRNLVRGFTADQRVVCVCGMVPSAELLTPAQSYFDRRVGWARRCDAAVYELGSPPADDPLFPLRVAQFGTGANFAVRRKAIIELGGFDEALGIGSPSGGGEDIDLFVRVLLAGWMLVREPAAVVWHRHRRSTADLGVQIHNYGLGLGAWTAKLLTHTRTFGMVMRRVIPGVRHLRGITVVDQSDTVTIEPSLQAMSKHELWGVLRGPVALIRARLAGRESAPLRSRSTRVGRALDFRRGQMWGEPGNSILSGRLALAAVVLSLVGALGAVRALPGVVLLVVVSMYLLAGPGSLLLSWYSHLPPYALLPLIPLTSIATCLLTVTAFLSLGWYDPVTVLLVLSAVTAAAGLARCAQLARPMVDTR